LSISGQSLGTLESIRASLRQVTAQADDEPAGRPHGLPSLDRYNMSPSIATPSPCGSPARRPAIRKYGVATPRAKIGVRYKRLQEMFVRRGGGGRTHAPSRNARRRSPIRVRAARALRVISRTPECSSLAIRTPHTPISSGRRKRAASTTNMASGCEGRQRTVAR